MANAGRVAIVPKGDWSAAVEYKRLDAVAFNNTLYIAKKAVPAGTLPTDTEYWMKCVVGGAGSIATTEDAGTVKAGADIGVDSTGEMILKTDFTEQSDLTELTGTEDRQTFFGKIAKAVSTLISHISLGATADKAGHVKLSNSSAVTDSTGLALPATEKNASLDGTMAKQIAALNKSLGVESIEVSCNTDVALNVSASKASGRMVCLNVVMTGSTQLAKNAFYTVASIPAEYAPPQSIRGVTVFGSGNVGFTRITEAGLIQIYPLIVDYVPKTSITIDETYFIDP